MKGPLSSAEIAMMRNVFRNHPAVIEVRLFGSRAKGTHTSRSDVDFAVFGNITQLEGEAIAAELDDLPLPYKYDVQVFDFIQVASLRDHIERIGLPVYPDISSQLQMLDAEESTEEIEATFRDLTAGRKDFWDLLRDTSSESLRALVTLALNEAKGSYREVAASFHVSDDDYRRFMDLLRRSNCIIDSTPFRRPSTPVS